MRRFLIVLFSLMLIVCSSHASSLGIDMSTLTQDMLIEHRCFLTADTDDYSEIIVLFYGHDTHKIRQINIETLFDKSKYSADDLTSFDPEEVFPGFRSMSFASMTVDETPLAINVCVTFAKLNEPQNFRQALQSGLFTGSFPGDYADVDTVAASLGGRELTMLEYGQVGLHFDVK